MAWEFFLCQSSDMTRLGVFTKAVNRSLTVALNRSGSYTCDVALSDPLATSIAPITTCIEAVKDNVTVWSGPVMSILTKVPEERITVQCLGWFELLKRRVIRDRGILTYSLVNGDFETGTETGWTFGVSGTGAHSNVTTTPHSGSRDEQLSTGGSASSAATMYQNVTGIPIGATVTLSVWINSNVTNSAWVASPQIGIVGSGPGLSPTYAVRQAFATTAGVWQQIIVNWVATVSAFAVLVNVNSVLDPVSTILVDDILLTYETLFFEDTDIGTIAQRLLTATNSWDLTPITNGTTATSWTRTVRYSPFQNVGEEIQRMSDVENGFDFDIAPTAPHALNIYYPMKGTLRSTYDSPNVAHHKAGATYYWNMDDSSIGLSTSEMATPSLIAISPANWTVNVATLCSYDPFGFAKSRVVGAGADFGQLTGPLTITPGSFTLSALFRISSLTSITSLGVFESQGWGNLIGFLADGSMSCSPGLGASGDTITTAPGTIVANTTYHTALTYDSTTKLAVLYLNGAVVGSRVCVSPFADQTFPGYGIPYAIDEIGLRGAGAVSPTVTMDEIAIWAGRSLSFAEITYLYQSLRLRTALPSGEVRFGYGDRGPRNIASITKLVDGNNMTNWDVVQGKGSSAGTGAFARNDDSITTYGAFDEALQLGQTDSIDLLAAYANAEIAVRSTPRLLYEFVPLVSNAASGVPSPFVDYGIGDIVQFDALVIATNEQGVEVGRPIDVADQNIRIFAITINLDDNGNEQVTLQTAPGT